MDVALFDVECYRNFFLVLLKRVVDGEILRFQISPNRQLDKARLYRVLRSHKIVGFNSASYDLPMIQLALKGATAAELKSASDEIIKYEMTPRDFAEKHELPRHNFNHIDLIQVAPLKASLKIYGGRLHCKKLQDLPIHPDAEITAEQAEQIVRYCTNDLDTTEVLFGELGSQVALRERLTEEYKQDLRSRSDPQVAERIIAAEIKKIDGMTPGRPQALEGTSYSYNIPPYVQYKLPQLQALLETIRKAKFVVGGNGSINLPNDLEQLLVPVMGGRYRIGIGGLHSTESSVSYVADDEFMLVDRDVTSYYPSIILNQGLYPKHLGEAFLQVYSTLVRRRIEAKKAGDKVTAESLKIAINGSFGKFGNKWSILYAPDLLIQVTLTGQLSLLMLIEMTEMAGIPVISANTDGILIRCPRARRDDLLNVIGEWERTTGFATEETLYRAVYAKDVNNYIAIKTDGSVKGKGLYANPWEVQGPNIFKLHKNPTTTIVIEAVVALLRDGTPLEKTIRGSLDIRKFVSVRNVTGGAKSGKEYLGKAIRWYYSTDSGCSVINYQNSGYKVPKSDRSKPLMELPSDFPFDVNHEWYIAEAKSTLHQIGYLQHRLFPAA